MNLGTTRLRGRPRTRWQDGVREDGRIVGGEGWQEKYITERNGRSSWEQQGIVTFCTCQWNEWKLAELSEHYVSRESRYLNRGKCYRRGHFFWTLLDTTVSGSLKIWCNFMCHLSCVVAKWLAGAGSRTPGSLNMAVEGCCQLQVVISFVKFCYRSTSWRNAWKLFWFVCCRGSDVCPVCWTTHIKSRSSCFLRSSCSTLKPGGICCRTYSLTKLGNGHLDNIFVWCVPLQSLWN